MDDPGIVEHGCRHVLGVAYFCILSVANMGE